MTPGQNWRVGFGRYDGEEGHDLERAVREHRERVGAGLRTRQRRVVRLLDETVETD